MWYLLEFYAKFEKVKVLFLFGFKAPRLCNVVVQPILTPDT
jgi:hypothetical protein